MPTRLRGREWRESGCGARGAGRDRGAPAGRSNGQPRPSLLSSPLLARRACGVAATKGGRGGRLHRDPAPAWVWYRATWVAACVLGDRAVRTARPPGEAESAMAPLCRRTETGVEGERKKKKGGGRGGERGPSAPLSFFFLTPADASHTPPLPPTHSRTPFQDVPIVFLVKHGEHGRDGDARGRDARRDGRTRRAPRGRVCICDARCRRAWPGGGRGRPTPGRPPPWPLYRPGRPPTQPGGGTARPDEGHGVQASARACVRAQRRARVLPPPRSPPPTLSLSHPRPASCLTHHPSITRRTPTTRSNTSSTSTRR